MGKSNTRLARFNLPILSLRFLLVILPSPSAAAPIRESSTSSSWPIYLSILLTFTALSLSASKYLFVRHRKASSLKGPPTSFVQGRYLRPTLGFLRFPAYRACKGDKGCKVGFLVGLFGSPSFEVCSKPSEITLIYPGANASGSFPERDLSGDTFTTCKTKSSTLSNGPVAQLEGNSPWQAQARKQSTPSLSLTKNTKSNFILPTQLSFDLGRIRRKQKPMCDQISSPLKSLPWPHNHLEHATLRLVKFYADPGPEVSLPLCSDKTTGLSPPPPSAHSFAVAHLNRSYLSSISPLPSLPVQVPEKELRMSPPDSPIDHPYNNVLLNLVKPGRQNTRRASLSPNLSVIEEVRNGALPEFPLGTILGLPAPCGVATGQIKAASAMQVLKSPPSTFSAYDTLKRREKLRSSSLRNRRSPPLGPSPLRSMILPDIPEDERISIKHTTVDEVKNNPAPGRTGSFQNQQIGLGLAPILVSPTKGTDKPQPVVDRSSESCESVLGFLRELAEETKDWDESIILDEGFRNMIQHSQAIFGYASLENVNIKCSTPKVPASPHGKGDCSSRFVSFWIEDSPSL